MRLYIEPNVILTSSKADDAIIDRLDPASDADGDDHEQRKTKVASEIFLFDNVDRITCPSTIFIRSPSECGIQIRSVQK